MKPNAKKGMLKLGKKAITNLNETEKKSVLGGAVAPQFTSIFHCSVGGFTCQCQTLGCTFTNTCQIK